MKNKIDNMYLQFINYITNEDNVIARKCDLCGYCIF